MAEIVNLRRVKRARARAEAAALAAENRVRHGQSKAAKEAADREKARVERQVDGASLRPETPLTPR